MNAVARLKTYEKHDNEVVALGKILPFKAFDWSVIICIITALSQLFSYKENRYVEDNKDKATRPRRGREELDDRWMNSG